MLRQDQLQVVPQSRFHRHHVLVPNPNPVRERTQDGSGLFERRQGARAEPLVRRVQLFQNIQPGALFRLLLEEALQFLLDVTELLRNLAQALLPFVNRGPLRLGIYSFNFHARGKFIQPRLESRPLFLQLNLFCRKLFQADHVPLLLQIERVEFIAPAADLLGHKEGFGLRATQFLLLRSQSFLDRLKGVTPGLQCLTALRQRGD